MLLSQGTGIEHHGFWANVLKVMSDLKVSQSLLLWQNLLKQRSQLWTIPLTVAQFKNYPIFCFVRVDLKELIKLLICRHDPKFVGQYDQPLAHGLHNALGQIPRRPQLLGVAFESSISIKTTTAPSIRLSKVR